MAQSRTSRNARVRELPKALVNNPKDCLNAGQMGIPTWSVQREIYCDLVG
jgi:hypothetical protein